MTDLIPSEIKYSQKGNIGKTPRLLIGITFIFACLIAGYGITSVSTPSTHSIDDSNQTFHSVVEKKSSVLLPADPDEADWMLKLGARLDREQCAGCHSLWTKLTGPSYEAIFSRYEDADDKMTKRLAFASTHNVKNWDGYAAGPKTLLSSEERRALAYWIIVHVKSRGKR